MNNQTPERVAKVNEIMQTIPKTWRHRWCGGENGPCACLGCVQIGNRLIMAEKLTGEPYRGDPEYIDESKIPDDIYNEFKIDRDEWEAWGGRSGWVNPLREIKLYCCLKISQFMLRNKRS